jgi:hypothetical protein
VYTKLDIPTIKDFVEQSGPNTKIYIGCDSERLRINGVWFADYILAVVVHMGGKHGCKIFGKIIRERDYDQQKNKPRMRLMNEVYKAAELYLELQAELDVEIEVHLDINPNEKYNSSIVINEAVGYIKGMCNVVPLIKPNAFAASYAADRMKTLVA